MSHRLPPEPRAPNSSCRNHRVVVLIDALDGVLPPSDRAAATLAIDRFGPVTACCPSGNDEAMRFALAAGCNGVADLSDLRKVDICLIGRGGAGVDGDSTAATLAASMDAMLVFEVLDVMSDNGRLRVERDLGRGAREVLRFAEPAVLLMSDDAPMPRYVSRYRRSRVTLPNTGGMVEPGEPLNWQPARQRPRTGGLLAKTAGDAQGRMFSAFGLSQSTAAEGSKVEGDTETCADQLIRYLAHHGFVERQAEPIAELATQPPAGEHGPSSDSRSDRRLCWSRAPRSLDRQPTGTARGPRSYRPISHRQRKLARGPRPLQGARRLAIRGPFPVTSRNLTDG